MAEIFIFVYLDSWIFLYFDIISKQQNVSKIEYNKLKQYKN